MPWQISPDVVWLDSDDEVRLYDASSGGFRTLNATAAAVWRAVAAGDDVDRMVDRFREDFHASDEAQRRRVESDVRGFLSGLRAEGLLVDDHADHR